MSNTDPPKTTVDCRFVLDNNNNNWFSCKFQ